MYFNSLPNAKEYSKTFAVIDNNARVLIAEGNKAELERCFGYGNVFETREKALIALEERKAPKVHHLTDDERKALEREQIAYGRSQMTEEEKAEARESRKPIAQKQLEFARYMMAMERGVLV